MSDYLELDIGLDYWGDDDVTISLTVHLKDGSNIPVHDVVSNPVRYQGWWVIPLSRHSSQGESNVHVPAESVTHFTVHTRTPEADSRPATDLGSGWRLVFGDGSVVDLNEPLLSSLMADGRTAETRERAEGRVRLSDDHVDLEGDGLEREWPSLCQIEHPDDTDPADVLAVAYGLVAALDPATDN